MEWYLKIDVKDITVFNQIEEKRNIKLSAVFRKFIMDFNGATPSKNRIMIGQTERVFGGVLSFNVEDMENVYSVLNIFNDKNIIPFARDSFGNYFCYNCKDNLIYFWNHELRELETSGIKFEEFEEKLY